MRDWGGPSDGIRHRHARCPRRRPRAARLTLLVTLALNGPALAQTEAAPSDPSNATAPTPPEQREAPDVDDASPAAESKPPTPEERLEDIVPPSEPPQPEPEDDSPLDQLEPWQPDTFLYPYPPAERSLPPPAPPTPARPRSEKPRSAQRWYGWQTLIADTMNISALSLAAYPVDDYATQESLVEIGLLGYFVGPPIVHWANGQAGKGWASLAIRTGSAGSAIVGMPGCFGSDGGPRCLLGISGLVGLIAAIPIDAAVLARKDVPREHGLRAPVQPEIASITPVVDAGHRRIGLSVGGRF